MPLNRTLLITCVTVAALATVRSHATSPTPAASADPAPLFSEVVATARPSPQTVAPLTPPARANTVFPFALDVPKPAAPAADGQPTNGPASVDESALRYFASQNDLGRVAAEIRLLRSKHPDWEPPQDLFADARGAVDEQPLWDLFARHDLDGLRAKIEGIRTDKPDWQPSSDLARKLALAEAHDALVKASDAKRWGDVIDVASGNKMLLTCGDVDALWRTAEALAHVGDEARATEAYRYVLATCTPADTRLATVQKASLVLGAPGALDSLLQMGKRRPDGRGEFEQVRLDLLRRKIGAVADGISSVQPTQTELDAVAANAAGPEGQADAQLLGWYAYARKDFAGAQKWFQASLADGPNGKAAEGLVLAFRDGGNGDQARRLAIQYGGLDQLNRKLMIETLSAALTDPKSAAPTDDELAAFKQAIDDEKSPDGAQSLGWHLYKVNDLVGAESWFRKSADWKPNESAAIGLIVTARRLHHDRDYAELVARYRGAYPKIAELEALMRSRPTWSRPKWVMVRSPHGSRPVRVAVHARRGRINNTSGAWDASADQIVKTYEAGQYDTAMTLLEQRRQRRAEPRGLSVIRGWALYHKGDWESAKQVFSSLDGGSPSAEKQEGLRAIQMGYTNPRYR